MSEVLQEAIAPRLRRVRRRLFHQVDAPFRTARDAARWIRRQAKGLPQPSERDRAAARELEREIDALAAKAARLTLTEWGLRKRTETLSYWNPPERIPVVVSVPSGPGAPITLLGLLQTSVADMAKATGFAEADLVASVLTGTPLVLPSHRVYVGLQMYKLGGLNCVNGRARIELNVRDISYTELRETYRLIRKAWQGHRISGRSKREQRLVRVVKGKGGPPVNRPCSRAFWEGVRRIMNSNYGCSYTSFHGPLMAYRIALKKVDDLR